MESELRDKLRANEVKRNAMRRKARNRELVWIAALSVGLILFWALAWGDWV